MTKETLNVTQLHFEFFKPRHMMMNPHAAVAMRIVSLKLNTAIVYYKKILLLHVTSGDPRGSSLRIPSLGIAVQQGHVHSLFNAEKRKKPVH